MAEQLREYLNDPEEAEKKMRELWGSPVNADADHPAPKDPSIYQAESVVEFYRRAQMQQQGQPYPAQGIPLWGPFGFGWPSK